MTVSIRPIPGIHDGHERVGTTHDSADSAMTKQMGMAYGKVHNHINFNNPVFSTLRMDCGVIHNPWIRSS
jgi:hypothetical protein